MTNIRVEMFLAGTSTQVDSQSLIAGDNVDLRLVGFDSSLVKHVISGASFSTLAPPSVLTIAGSRLTAISGSGGTSYSVTGSTPSYSASAPALVAAGGSSIVTGLVRTVAGDPVYQTIVKFYDASNTLLASTKTVSNGTFRAGVPSTAKKFTIDLTVADPPASNGTTRFVRQFGYGTLDYSANSIGCLAPLPALVVGTNALPHDIVPPLVNSSSPPPPPTGCFG